ncbi:hypothetical protein CDL15_Pgr027688 [Punica granatum]|uniref:Uncharacterized protein n=1 Tax=Punica granatum TaxID=22663 RepID=A0A218XKA1_PUNGR|nr:hypothetical protein CDL15_Pgr027688 [Punica granatum]
MPPVTHEENEAGLFQVLPRHECCSNDGTVGCRTYSSLALQPPPPETTTPMAMAPQIIPCLKVLLPTEMELIKSF